MHVGNVHRIVPLDGAMGPAVGRADHKVVRRKVERFDGSRQQRQGGAIAVARNRHLVQERRSYAGHQVGWDGAVAVKKHVQVCFRPHPSDLEEHALSAALFDNPWMNDGDPPARHGDSLREQMRTP